MEEINQRLREINQKLHNVYLKASKVGFGDVLIEAVWKDDNEVYGPLLRADEETVKKLLFALEELFYLEK
jgi:hypothetical protein